MQNRWQDLRFRARGWTKQPGLILLVMLTLALWVGSGTVAHFANLRVSK